MTVVRTSPIRPSTAELLGPIATVDDINIRSVRYFLTVADTGSVSSASALLQVAQPTLSQQIKRLESRIGFELFTRNGRGLVLTAAGEAFRNRIAPLPLQIRDAIEAARPSPPPHVLHLALCPGIAYTRISDLTRLLQGCYANKVEDHLDVRLHSTATSDLLADLKQQRIALGVVRLPFDHKEINVTAFRTDVLGIAVHSNHAFAGRDAVTWNELSAQQLLCLDTAQSDTERGGMLSQLHQRGWFPETVSIDDDHPAVITHTLAANPSTLMLTSRDDLPASRELHWIPLSDNPIEETLALVAARSSVYARVPRELAGRMTSRITETASETG